MDKEVLRDIWQGQLPLCFKLHPDDVSGMHRPEPYYMMVPRITYFPVVLDRVVKYFTRFMDNRIGGNPIDNMWLDYDGQPIKWHHQVGLSWDLFGSEYDLPWRLILHFSDFPEKDLVKCNTKSSIKTIFMSSIKEADALKHKGSVTKNMLEKDQNLLWSSLVNDKFDQFWSVNKRLMDRLDNELFRCIPFRLYFPNYTYVQKIVRPCTVDKLLFLNPARLGGSCRAAEGADDGGTRHLLQTPLYDKEVVINKSHKCGHTASELEEACSRKLEHRYTTMLDLIQTTFINRLDDLLISSETSGEQDESEKCTGDRNAAHDADQDGRSSKDRKLIDVSRFKYRFLAHGIEIPYDTPLQWLSEHLSYPDNFLHICAVTKDNLELI